MSLCTFLNSFHSISYHLIYIYFLFIFLIFFQLLQPKQRQCSSVIHATVYWWKKRTKKNQADFWSAAWFHSKWFCFTENLMTNDALSNGWWPCNYQPYSADVQGTHRCNQWGIVEAGLKTKKKKKSKKKRLHISVWFYVWKKKKTNYCFVYFPVSIYVFFFLHIFLFIHWALKQNFTFLHRYIIFVSFNPFCRSKTN